MVGRLLASELLQQTIYLIENPWRARRCMRVESVKIEKGG